MSSPEPAEQALLRMAQEAQQQFVAQRSVLSMAEYLALVAQDPWRYTRDAARYLADCFDHFGAYEVRRPWGVQKRWRLFDATEGRGALLGQERVQQEFYQALRNFVREGGVRRLLLLHGPNGSAKSTFAASLMQALQTYSQSDAGAQYRFSWVFPRSGDAKGIGFAAVPGDRQAGVASYAHLPEDRIEVKLQSELRENPLLLLPMTMRRGWLEQLYAEAGVQEGLPDLLAQGGLSRKNQQIFQALWVAYRGDLQRVLAHVQVERFSISQRYRCGAVTIGPQMAVDARERQLSASFAYHALPASLGALTLMEPFGELVDGSGGLIEFSDLLKRPLEAWKYLLLAIESGEVPLEMSNLTLNAVLLASSNELHLEAFRGHPDYNSFRGRMHFVAVPYLLDWTQEQAIYEAHLLPQLRCHVAPHAILVAAQWAVLTRLQRADASSYADAGLGRLAADLTPTEKLDLYAEGLLPARLPTEQSKQLAQTIAEVYGEASAGGVPLEGMIGASPREMRAILLDALHAKQSRWLSPLAVLEQLDAFCRRSDYDFLQQRPDSGYHDAQSFITQVKGRWLDKVDDELQRSAGLIDENRQVELFERYIAQVSNWMKGERAVNRVTGKMEEPDVELMRNVEGMLEVHGDHDAFRRDLLSVIAGYAMQHPAEDLHVAKVFPKHIERLSHSYFRDRARKLATMLEDVILLLEGAPAVDASRQAQADTIAQQMRSRYSYQDASMLEALTELRNDRYLMDR